MQFRKFWRGSRLQPSCRGADSVDPVQIKVHGRAPAGHNHLLKCPALARATWTRVCSARRVRGALVAQAEKQEQWEHEGSECDLQHFIWSSGLRSRLAPELMTASLIAIWCAGKMREISTTDHT